MIAVFLATVFGILAVFEGVVILGAYLSAVDSDVRERALHTAWLARVRTQRKFFGYLQGANARRKRLERILRNERSRHESRRTGIFKIGSMLADALVENANLKVENQHLESRNRVLAAEVTAQLLTAQDREGVVKDLTRKL